jgi:hypothetical protein
MAKVTVCIYCAKEIDQDNVKWTEIPSVKGQYAHLDCYTKENAPGRPSQSTPGY